MLSIGVLVLLIIFMREQQWQRMVRVMRETGDKAFIMDTESDQVFMMMNLDDYESLIGLDVNDEADDEDDLLGGFVLDDSIDTAEKATEKKESIKEFAKEPVRETIKASRPDPLPLTVEPMGELGLVQPHPSAQIIGTETAENEESIKDVPNDGEEEKFYLEPLE